MERCGEAVPTACMHGLITPLPTAVRDRHFDDVLYRVRAHLRSSRGPDADRVVVWAHNSHVGDASGTERAKRGETNLGELSRSVGGKSAIVNVGAYPTL